MSRLKSLVFLSLILALCCGMASAQEPSLAPSDLEFTQKILAKYHYAASVDFGPEGEPSTHFQYDHYPDDNSERLKTPDGVFTRQKGKNWIGTDAGGKPGAEASSEVAAKFDTYVHIVQAPFSKGSGKDISQGGTVWKFIGKRESKEITYFTYERTREHPRPDGVYPRFTFMKAAPDTDGQLFMCMATGNLRSGEQRFPFTVHLWYLVPIPAGAKIQIFDKDTGKKKVDEIVKKNSGWEITSQQSTPPASD